MRSCSNVFEVGCCFFVFVCERRSAMLEAQCVELMVVAPKACTGVVHRSGVSIVHGEVGAQDEQCWRSPAYQIDKANNTRVTYRLLEKDEGTAERAPQPKLHTDALLVVWQMQRL
jgi:hypothetical protein